MSDKPATLSAKKVSKKMDPAFKARWLEALRGGRYPQTHGTLRNAKGFCCLGVALDVIDSGQWHIEGWGDRDDGTSLPRFEMDETTYLGSQLGINGAVCNQLAVYNDGNQEEARGAIRAPWTFAQIADWIEENL